MRPRQAAVLERADAAGRWRALQQLRADGAGVVNALVGLRGGARLRLCSGALVSAPARIGARASRP
jgi:hypothetical protein